MTECPKCKGYGIIGDAVPDILRGRGAIFSSNECDMCRGSGEVQQTNEEWLRSATFEELAGAIYEWHTKGYARGRLEVDLKPITEVVEWLKQQHNNEVEK